MGDKKQHQDKGDAKGTKLPPLDEDEHISLLSKIGATVTSGVFALGLAWAGVSTIINRNAESAAFQALEILDVNTPSGRTLGDVFCTAAKTDGRYGVEFEKSIDKAVIVKLADGSIARINCAEYTLSNTLN